jgi:hypothetical protein
VPKKLPAALVSILGLAALAALPTAAQASSPHWYVNGSVLAETEKVPVISWGRLTLQPEPAVAQPTTCENAAGGYVENPAGGGAGKGATLRFASWNCSSAECPAGKVSILGKEFEKESEVSSAPQSFPWPSELIGTAPKFKTNSTGVVVKLDCVAHGFTRSEAETGKATGPGENEQFSLMNPPTCVATATNLWDPENINGSNQGNLQSTLVFNQPAGTGLSCKSGEFTILPKDTLKVMGYSGSELITVKAP